MNATRGFVAGAAGGALGTAAMAGVLALAEDGAWLHAVPPRRIARSALRELGVTVPRSQARLVGSGAHFLFGTALGALFGHLYERDQARLPGVAAGVGFTTLVWIVSYYGWVPALRFMPLPHALGWRHNAAVVGGTWIWGMLLGAVVERAVHGRRT